jgi:hypothetical protein
VGIKDSSSLCSVMYITVTSSRLLQLSMVLKRVEQGGGSCSRVCGRGQRIFRFATTEVTCRSYLPQSVPTRTSGVKCTQSEALRGSIQTKEEKLNQLRKTLRAIAPSNGQARTTISIECSPSAYTRNRALQGRIHRSHSRHATP